MGQIKVEVDLLKFSQNHSMDCWFQPLKTRCLIEVLIYHGNIFITQWHFIFFLKGGSDFVGIEEKTIFLQRCSFLSVFIVPEQV